MTETAELFAHCASKHVDPEPATEVHVVHTEVLTPWDNTYKAVPYCDLCARHTRHKALRVSTPAEARSWGWQRAS